MLELRIEGKRYVFNSLYRVWMIESIFSNVLEQKYKAENALERAQQDLEEQDIEESNDEKEKCESLEQVREQIDHLDQQLIDLIATRQFYVDQAVRFKRTTEDAQSPERVQQVIDKVRQKAFEVGTDPDLVETIYRAMIQHFIQRELKEIRP